jgi:hypothetical protein
MATGNLVGGVEERQIDGNFGEIYHNGHYQGDLRDFTGRIAIERRELPRAGGVDTVYRRGRVTREGTFRLTKIDSRWEELFFNYSDKSPEDMRGDRARGVDSMPDMQFIIRLDDPASWGAEEIALFGVKFWELGIGFTSNDMLERDLPCTWQANTLVRGIPRPGNKHGWTPPPGEQTWPAAGRDPDPVI